VVCQRILSLPGRTRGHYGHTGEKQKEDAGDAADDRDIYSIRATESPANHGLPSKKPSQSKSHRLKPRQRSDLESFLENSPSSVAASGATYRPSEEDQSDETSDTESGEASEDFLCGRSNTNKDVVSVNSDSQSTSDGGVSPTLSRRRASVNAGHALPLRGEGNKTKAQRMPRSLPVGVKDRNLQELEQRSRYLRNKGSAGVVVDANSNGNASSDEARFEGFLHIPNSDVVRGREVIENATLSTKVSISSALQVSAVHRSGSFGRQNPTTEATTRISQNHTARDELEVRGNDIVPSLQNGGRRALSYTGELHNDHNSRKQSSGLSGSEEMIDLGICSAEASANSRGSWDSTIPGRQATRSTAKKRRQDDEPGRKGEPHSEQYGTASTASSSLLRSSSHSARPSFKRQKGNRDATSTREARMTELNNLFSPTADDSLPDFDAYLPRRGRKKEASRCVNIEAGTSYSGALRASAEDSISPSIVAGRGQAESARPNEACRREQESVVGARSPRQTLVAAPMDSITSTATTLPPTQQKPLPGQYGTILGGLGTEDHPVWLDTPRKHSAPAAIRVKSESPSPSSDPFRAIDDNARSSSSTRSVNHKVGNKPTRSRANASKDVDAFNTQQTPGNHVDHQGHRRSQGTQGAVGYSGVQTSLAPSQRLTLLNVHYLNRLNPLRKPNPASPIQRPSRDSFIADVRVGRQKQKVLVVPRHPDRSPMPPPKRGRIRPAPGYEN